jgi:hypothetical protein
MSDRSTELAAQLEQAVAELEQFAMRLSDDDWQCWCPDAQRSVGQLIGHIGLSIPYEMAAFQEMAAGHQPAPVSMMEIDELNAQELVELGRMNRGDTLAVLRANADEAAQKVRELTPEQLQRTGQFIDELDVRTVEQWIELVFPDHINEHLTSIHAALSADGG